MAGNRQRIAVAVLALSAAGFSAWKTSEGDGPTTVQPGVGKVHRPYIPTKGDVPTIGHGSTRYENGTLVKLSDKPITPQRAEQLARNLMAEDEKVFRASIPGVELFQEEYDLYLDFFGQYGSGNWRSSTSRRELLAGNYPQACQALLKFRFQGGRDCSLPQNWGPKGCKGVWTRQQKRVAQCMAVQVAQ